MSRRWWGLLGALAIAALLARGRELAGGAVAATTGVARMAMAIARAEGFAVPGSIPARARNPGNLKLGGETINGITVFPSEAAGWSALYRQLQLILEGRSRYYSLDMTIRQMGQTWTATQHEQLAWAANVARTLGVSMDTPLRTVLGG